MIKLMLLFLLLARSHLTTLFAMRNTRYASRNAFHAVAVDPPLPGYHYQGTVSPGIAQAVFDMASGSPGPVCIGPAMQTVVRPGNKESLVRWRHKRKIEHACENPDTDYTKGEFPEMSFVQTWLFIRLRRVVYNDSIPAGFSPTCHYLSFVSKHIQSPAGQ